MASGNPVEELCDETTCSVCLEYFQQPVITDCGHIFCQACLARCWEKPGAASCPQCREAMQTRDLRPSRQLANVVELVKKLEEARKEGQRGVCGRHQEPLKLFCRDDEASICVVCDRSKGHREHRVVPVEEAVQSYMEKIQAQVQSLEKEKEKIVGWKLVEEERSQRCLTQLGVEKQQVMSAFERMQAFLEEKEHFWLTQLGSIEKEIEKRREENVTRFSGEISRLSHLITEMERKRLQPAHEFLQDIRNTLGRYQKGEVKLVLELSPETEERFRSYSQRSSILMKAIEKCEGSLTQTLNKVNVTLDRDTAHSCLVLAEDLKSVRGELKRQEEQATNSERFDLEPCVLGHERFTSGRHWWEVVVEEEREGATWAVGVAKQSIKRKGDITINPEEGIWAVGKIRNHFTSPCQLSALTFPVRIPLNLRKDLRKIRVSLEYKEGHVKFFDADMDYLICDFPSASFSGEGIHPFLWVGSGVRMKC